MTAILAVVLSAIALSWQVFAEIRRRRTRVRVTWDTDGRDLVLRVVNLGDVPELVRYVALERRLSFREGARADAQRMPIWMAGAFGDPVVARRYRESIEASQVDIGVVHEFDPAIEVRPRADASWRTPLSDLAQRDWKRGCYARVQLATGWERRSYRWVPIQKWYAKRLENTLNGLPKDVPVNTEKDVRPKDC